ncbi:MAG: MBL fold metallo-hydrolase [Lachnospiraceae bacterium]|nr:MBL fold metallo-hydrolase [Lachnospiraceae bacterium]
MKVTYIYHSCYIVEFEKEILIFDYFMGKLPEFDRNKKIYFFASHKHHDHFDMCIFKYADKYPNVKYILSNDIRISEKYLERNGYSKEIKSKIITVGKRDEKQIDEMKVETLKSNDAGVAFVVTVAGKCIYHAGDLNWWHWEGEPEDYNSGLKFKYIVEIEKLKDRKIDVAFVPLDSRLNTSFYKGLDHFARNTKAELIFPMHMWRKYEIIEKFKRSEITKEYRQRIINVEKENESWVIEE